MPVSTKHVFPLVKRTYSKVQTLEYTAHLGEQKSTVSTSPWLPASQHVKQRVDTNITF